MQIVTDYSEASIERRSVARLQAARNLAFRAAVINIVMFAMGVIITCAILKR